MPRATMACPLRRPATHSLTTPEAILFALAAGRAVGAAQAPDAPVNALARVGQCTSHGHRERAAGGAVRASEDFKRTGAFENSSIESKANLAKVSENTMRDAVHVGSPWLDEPPLAADRVED